MIQSKYDMYLSNDYNVAQIGTVSHATNTEKGTFVNLTSKVGKSAIEIVTRDFFIPEQVKEGDRIAVILSKTGKEEAKDKEGKPVISQKTGKPIMNQKYFTQVFVKDGSKDVTFNLDGLDETK